MIFGKGSIYGDVLFWYLQRRVFLHKMIMIFVKGSIYGDAVYFDIYKGVCCYIKWLWYLVKDQYMADVSFWYLQSGVLLHKMTYDIWQRINIWRCVYFDIYRVLLHKMINDICQRINIWRCVYFDIYRGEYFYIKWLWYLSKDQYMEMCVFILIFTRGECCYIKWLWYLSKDQYMYADMFILIFTEWSIVT